MQTALCDAGRDCALRLWRTLGLLGLLLFCAIPTHAQWVEVRTDKFVITGDWSEKRLVDFATRLEKFDQLLRLKTRVNDDSLSPPLRVLVLPSDTQVQELKGTDRGRVAGFYRPTLQGPIAIVSRDKADHEFDLTGQVVLFHEYAHHFMLQHVPAAYPQWFVEGFAEYFSTVEFRRNGEFDVGKAPPARMPSLALGKWVPLKRLLRTVQSDEPIDLGMLYAQGWLLTHYFYSSADRNRQFGEYLRLMHDGTPSGAALEQAFGHDVEQLDRELQDYLKKIAKAGIKFERFSGWKLEVGKLAVRPVPAAEVAALQLDALHSPRMANVQANELQARANELAATHSEHPLALTIAAEVMTTTDNLARADELLDKALTIQSDHPRALVAKAAIQLRRVADADHTDKRELRAIRTAIARANRANPQDAAALYYFYESFRAAGETPTANAVDALVTAQQLVPHMPEVRMRLARELVRLKEFDRAATTLRPLAYAPHATSATEVARQLLESIEQRAANPIAESAKPAL